MTQPDPPPYVVQHVVVLTDSTYWRGMRVSETVDSITLDSASWCGRETLAVRPNATFTKVGQQVIAKASIVSLTVTDSA